jgi:hypothetical protein
MGEHDFGFAIKALKGEFRVSRKGWNGKGMWPCLVSGDKWGLGSSVPYDAEDAGSNLLPWIGMKTADGSFVPWLASQTVLATDWDVVD